MRLYVKYICRIGRAIKGVIYFYKREYNEIDSNNGVTGWWLSVEINKIGYILQYRKKQNNLIGADKFLMGHYRYDFLNWDVQLQE